MSVPQSVLAAAEAGERLDVLLARGRLPLVRSLRIAAGAAQALGALHDTGRWHGRLRPAALRLSVTADAVVLADPADPLCADPDTSFQAPEQAAGMNREPDHRCDFYFLGLLLRRMLAGESAADSAAMRRHVAEPVADIVDKLLAPLPEDRYQSVPGLLHDLQRCLHTLEAGQRLSPFVLGTDDISDRFQPSHRLCGREAELRLLKHAVDRVTADGRTEVMLVCGSAGVGKTALVQALRPHVAVRGGRLSQVACTPGSQHVIAQLLRDIDAGAAHPQVLVLDDLQQADAASLAFIEPLLAGPRLTRLLLIGIFRHDELHAGHPLAALLSRIDRRGALLQRLTLRPLRPADIERLLADTLHCEPARAARLARRAFEETQGLPRACHRLLRGLHDDGLIAFDHHRRAWRWDIAHIEARHAADRLAVPVVDAAGLRAELQRTRDALAASRHELDAAQQQLTQARTAAGIGVLAAGMARELDNPMVLVSAHVGMLSQYARDLLSLVAAYETADAAIAAASPSHAELIERRKQAIGLAPLREDLPELVRESEEGLLWLTQVVHDLQDFSHPGENHWQRMDLHRSIERTLGLACQQLDHPVEVLRQFGTLPEIECLPAALSQLLMQLAIDALRSANAGGRLLVRTGAEDAGVWLEMSSDGGAVAAPGGADPALVLAWSQAIVKKHGGTLHVSGGAEGGRRMRLWLPVAQRDTTD